MAENFTNYSAEELVNSLSLNGPGSRTPYQQELRAEILRLVKLAKKGAAAPSELDKAVQRWLEAKREQVLREDCKGDLQHEVRHQERDVEDAIAEELAALPSGKEKENQTE